MSDHTPTIFCMEMMTLSVYFNVEMIVRRCHVYQSVLVAVDEKLPCHMDLFIVAVMTGELIIGREEFRSLIDASTTNR